MNEARRQTLTMTHYAFVFLISLGLWMLLAGSLQLDELLLGGFVALTITVFFAHQFSIFTGFRFSLYAPFYIMVYLFNFSIALIRANLDLARRVLSPSLPINPALVTVTTQLQSPLARLLLANTITLTPGTLTVDVMDDKLLVHWVYYPPGTDLEQATRQIAATFERDLGRFLL